MSFRICFLLLLLFSFYSCSKSEKKTEDIHDRYEIYDKKKNKEAYLDILYDQTLTAGNDSLAREELFKIAVRYEWLNNEQKFKTTLKKVYQLAKERKDSLHQARVFWYLGDFYDNKQIADSTYYYYFKAERLYASQQDSINWARMLLYKAGVLYDIGIYTESEIATVQALKMLSGHEETRLVYEATVQMTLILKELKEYKAALPYYLKLPTLLHQLEVEQYDTHQLQRSWLSYYNNIGGYYNDTDQVEEAMNYFELALDNQYVDDYPKLKAMILVNYAQSCIEAHKNYAVIDSLLDTSLALRKSSNHQQGIIDGKIRIATFGLIKQDTISAIALMEDAYKMAVEHKSGYEVIESLKFLAQYHPVEKEAYYARYVKTQDSLYNVERQTRNKFARIAYETDEVEKENAFLVQRNMYLGGIVMIVLFLSLIFFALITLHLKNKKLLYEQKDQQAIQQIQTLLLQQQSLTNETKNQERKRIAKDLHDSIINRVFTVRLNLDQLSTPQQNEKEQLMHQLKQIETQTRALSHDMHETLFSQEQDFSLILMNLVSTQKNVFQTVFECSIDRLIDWEVFTLAQKAQVYLILQEVLQNVNKHAQATKCLVIMLLNENNVCIRIHDNGVGIDPKQVGKGMGFKNIRYRIQVLNGSMAVSIVNKMTTIRLEIPYNK